MRTWPYGFCYGCNVAWIQPSDPIYYENMQLDEKETYIIPSPKQNCLHEQACLRMERLYNEVPE